MQIPFIPTTELPYVASGFAGIIAFWTVFYLITHNYEKVRNMVKRTGNTREFALFICNLLIVAIGLSISVNAYVLTVSQTSINATTDVTAVGGNMTTEQLNALNTSAQGLLHMVYVLIGVALGVIVIWIIHNVIVARKERTNGNNTNKDFNITLSSTKLDSSLETLKDVSKSITILNEFSNRVKQIMDGKQNEKKDN
jgi:uncharacterized membrane protein YuzA (DUF378 family)